MDDTQQKPTFGTEEEKTTDSQKKREELGVIWKRVDKYGNEYLSVKLKTSPTTQIDFKAFKNKNKKDEDSKPDFIAYKDTQKVTDKK